MAKAADAKLQRWNLTKETELRLEVGEGAPAFVKLISGNAEAFGVELAEGRTYTLAGGRKLAVFTWYGGEVHTWGNVAAVYTSAETQMTLYANLHSRLEARRVESASASAASAGSHGGQGPRVMVVGPTDSGKSSLCRVLCSYACRVGRSPTFVDLDLGQGEVSIPGTLAASPLDKVCLSVEEGYTYTTPLVYYFGHMTAGEFAPVYKNYLQRLSDTINRRMSSDPIARSSGLVINTMGWIDGGGYDLILETIKSLQADVIVVMGHDRLFAQLSEDVKTIKYHSPSSAAAGSADAGASSAAGGAQPTKHIEVIKLNRPGGVVERSRETRRDARKSRIKEYFYGPDRGPGVPPTLYPEMITVKFEDVTIVKVGGAVSESGLVPIGKASALDPLRVTVVNPSNSLLNHVLGVSFATSDKQVPHVNVAGFVHVRAVNMEARTITLLAPSAEKLPTRYLVMGSSTFVD